jgi:N-ethylmaleimide reductase
VYTGTLLAVGGFTKASGEAAIANGRADLIVYGRPFIANPDLVERFRLDASLNSWDVRTFYGGDDHGYTDYPTLINRVDYRDSMRIEHLGHFHKVKLYP